MPYIAQSVLTPPPVAKVEAVLGPARQGKVRAIWDLGEFLLMMMTNRISAFDDVLTPSIEHKGAVLMAMSDNWFKLFSDIPHHLVAAGAAIDEYLIGAAAVLRGDPEIQKISMIVRKYEPLLIECITRLGLTGSGYKDYVASGKVCGIQLPPGLRNGDLLDEILFTPSTKEDVGHDRNITEEEAIALVGERDFGEVKDLTIEILRRANEFSRPKGTIVADTKIEFGRDHQGRLFLIDEVLTPDSSRFWPEDGRLRALEAGEEPPSKDKQYVRNYLESIKFRALAPEHRRGFRLPPEVCQRTTGLYLATASEFLGKSLAAYHRHDLGITA